MLAEQLREEKVVTGETWAHDFCNTGFGDVNATSDVSLPRQRVCEGVHGCLKVLRGFTGG